MRFKSPLFTRGLLLSALATQIPMAALGADEAPLGVPLGITFQDTFYADAKGMTLYTFAKDAAPGKSSCVGECEKTWPPVLAATNAVSAGRWSVIARGDGARQWALDGRPVYTYSDDKSIGESKGQSLDNGDWRTLKIDLDDGRGGTPAGIKVREVGDAAGRGLVDYRGITVYALNGNLSAGPLASPWQPLEAAELARNIGAFSTTKSPDGRKQWAYQGKPLYLYRQDVIPGDAKGIDVDPRLGVAIVERHFMPRNVVVKPILSWGTILATTEGKTLYLLDGYRSLTGAHQSRVANRSVPATGRRIGTGGCDTQCLKTHIPFKAPADAVASGHWTILTRDDGTRQWAYRGYALYTFAGDKKPGDIVANNTWIVRVSQKADKVVEDNDVGVAYNWHIVYP